MTRRELKARFRALADRYYKGLSGMDHRVSIVLHRVIAVLASLAFGVANAQDYPSRSIRLIIPFAAGNTGETSFRLIAPTLEARLGQRFIIENRPGASGNVGAQEVARAAPDGYTLLLGATSVFVANQFVYKNTIADPLALFEPITLVSDMPTLVVVSSKLPVSNLRELQAYAKRHPGTINFGSSGLGTGQHISGAVFAELAGIDIVHVPYKGSSAAALAVLTGEAPLYFSVMNAVEGHLRSGRAKALAVASPTRLAALPDVPTTAESGFPEMLAGTWWGMAAPKGTDRRIVDRLAAEIRAALSDPSISSRIAALGMAAGGLSPAEFATKMQTEAARLRTTLEKLRIKLE